MKKTLMFSAILLVFLPWATAQECDYGIKLIIEAESSQQNFSFKIAAMNIKGPATNISSDVTVLNNGAPVKNYFPWKNVPISRQKTSSKYSPNLEIGNYEIKANLQTLCKDSDLSNNFDSLRFAIISEDAKIPAKEKYVIDLEENGTDKPNNEKNDYDNFIYSRKNYSIGNFKPAEYSSSNEKSKIIAFYALIGISITVIAIIFRWKR